MRVLINDYRGTSPLDPRIIEIHGFETDEESEAVIEYMGLPKAGEGYKQNGYTRMYGNYLRVEVFDGAEAQQRIAGDVAGHFGAELYEWRRSHEGGGPLGGYIKVS